ncbi:MAG: energy transducer TonB, partial [Bacteroidales bacterium]|nr:energy transducer TonB [Bacteroidales bacterium]
MKKTLYILTLIIGMGSYAMSQQTVQIVDRSTRNLHQQVLQEENLAHADSVDVRAEFPGGYEVYTQFLRDHIQYPQEALDSQIEGRVYLTFVIEKDGTVEKVYLHQKVAGGCTEAVTNALAQMPKWKPGSINGELQRIGWQLDIVFRLQDTAVLTPADRRRERAQYLIDNNFVHPDSIAVLPQFPGGEQARQAFLNNNMTYPTEARWKGIQGTVYVSFIVEEDGTVTTASVHRGIGEACDMEAMRVVMKMPKWKPAIMKNGKPV